jgi:hypothetical protein
MQALHSAAVAPELSDRLVAAVAARLGSGGMRYSPRQLYYAACAAAERPPVGGSAAQLGCGVALVLLAVVGGVLISPYLGLVLIPALLLINQGRITRVAELRRPTTRPLIVGYQEFVTGHVEPLRAVHPETLAGLLETWSPPEGPGGTPMVVCDHAETAAVLNANLRVAGVGAHAVAAEAAAARMAGETRVFCLHDADPAGCALPLRLRDRYPGSEIVDLGLRPAHITGRRIPVIEGAPAVVPVELSTLLEPDEVVWLADGRRVEVAILGPAELVAAVAAAVDPTVRLRTTGADRVLSVVASPIPVVEVGPTLPSG